MKVPWFKLKIFTVKSFLLLKRLSTVELRLLILSTRGMNARSNVVVAICNIIILIRLMEILLQLKGILVFHAYVMQK